MLVIWLAVLSAVAYLDRTNISIAGIQIGKEFAIDKIHLGWVFSAFLIGYAAFQIPAGLLARRLGPQALLTAGAAWWGVFTVLTALVPPGVAGAVMILVLVRFALGVGEATMYPATSQFVERWFPVKERGRANGIIFAGVGLGSGLTPHLVSWIIRHHGWRASFWFSACIGAAAGLVWYFASRDTPEKHPWVADTERELIVQHRQIAPLAAPANVAANYGKQQIPWARIFSSRTVLALAMSYFSYGYVAWIYFAWMYIYLAEVRGLDLKTSATYTMLPLIAMSVGSLTGGVVSDWIAARWGLRMGRCLLPGIALCLTAVLLLLGSRADSTRTAALVLAGGAGVLYLAQSAFFAVSADVAGEFTGVVSGLMNMGGQIGGACTASLTPLIAARFGWEISFLTAAILVVIGGLAWIVIDPHQQLALAQRSGDA
ncbi:MAG: MFS transporter [Acidobacteriota bacterium]|nr:MFS transporter [Acidobacteriota bacterium]